jgi:hypothetical protein
MFSSPLIFAGRTDYPQRIAKSDDKMQMVLVISLPLVALVIIIAVILCIICR